MAEVSVKSEIEHVSINELKFFPDNPRVHTPAQIEKLAQQIKDVGFNQPIIIDEDNQVMVGNGRLEAAQSLDMQTLPCIRYKDLSPQQKKQLIVADNKLNDLSEWDYELLGDWFNDLNEANLDSYFTNKEMTDIWTINQPTKKSETAQVKSHESEKDKKGIIISEINKVIKVFELMQGHGEEIRILELVVEYISKK